MHHYDEVRHFEGAGRFYRGNLHCHSTLSDGALSPESLVDSYISRGYQFLCISDHEVFRDHSALSRPGFLTLSGAEWSTREAPGATLHQCHHVNIIEGTQAMLSSAKLGRYKDGERFENPIFDGEPSLRYMLDTVLGHGCIATYNHPVWSRTRPADFGLLDGFAGVEVLNRGCELEDFTGNSEVYWDNLLSDGARLWGMASDDNHNRHHRDPSRPDDSFGGWLMVHCEDLTRDSIIQAILDGRFYASSGPEIHRYGIEGGKVYVECTAVNQVNFVCGGGIGVGSTAWSEPGRDGITRAEHTISGGESYIRIRCQRADGKTAWSQPLYPN